LNLGGTTAETDGFVRASGAFGADMIKGIENLTGSAYADTLTGNSSVNVLDGGLGNDTLAGGFGKDTLTGGSGADKFLFNAMETTANRDTVTDFLVLDADKIQFSKSAFAGFAALGTITTAMLAIDGAAQTSATRLIYSNTTGILSYDADGSGTAQAAVEVALIGVTTHALLTTAQFELVA
jgi:Ca2+-binding RTX toxin-like protein